MKCYCGSYAINEDRDEKLCDVCYYKLPLLDLLAVIHRDGGYYVGRFGLKRAVDDAKRIAANWVVK